MKPVLREAFPEVPLEPAPLVLVLCQLRYNALPELASRAAVEDIREALGGDYPDIEARSYEGVQIDVGPPGVQLLQQASKSHVLRSPHHPWWILLSEGVASLVTPQYSSRKDFMGRVSRLRQVLQAAGVPAVQRVGVRYVSRVEAPDFIADLPRYVNREMLGGTQLPLAEDVTLAQSLLDVAIPWDEHNVVRIRTGIVGPGVVADPAIPPLPSQSWVLDIDAFNEKYQATNEVDDSALGLAENQYHLFRSIVTNDFLERFGGNP